MKLINWLFGIYKGSYALQLLLKVLVGIHVGVGLTVYAIWLTIQVWRMFA